MNEWRFHPASDPSTDAGQAALNSLSAADIHKQLEHIVESSGFRGSLRLTNFLKFVVETTLAGKAASIKAYTIAVEALGRGGDFDPQRDPIVRVEAGRLRQALARYYGEAGRDEPLLIEMPRGTYVPVFRRREPTSPPQVPAAHEFGAAFRSRAFGCKLPGISAAAQSGDPAIQRSRRTDRGRASGSRQFPRAATAAARWHCQPSGAAALPRFVTCRRR